MKKTTREQFLKCLHDEWQPYVGRFQRLPAAEQKTFLEKQGYATLADLLAHIIAWWQDGAQVVAQMRADPTLVLPDYDVDDFNARAVERFRYFNEADVLQAYAVQWQVMLDLVSGLSDAELDADNINTRLFYEIIMHWTEHELG